MPSAQLDMKKQTSISSFFGSTSTGLDASVRKQGTDETFTPPPAPKRTKNDIPIPSDNCDIGLIEDIASLNADEKCKLLRKHFVPGENYNFPTTLYQNKNRRFSVDWLTKKEYAGLVYSKAKEGGYCIYCCLFGSSDLGILSTSPLTDMKHTHARLGAHYGTDKKEPKKTHLEAHEKVLQFLNVHENKQKTVVELSNKNALEKIERNRTVLSSVIKTVLLCGRQNIALRGHRDDSRHISDPDINSGNFQALIDFRMDAGDSVLSDYLATGPKNATYRSKTIQNSIILAIGDKIVGDLINEIKSSQFYSISADEKADTSHSEQLSVVVRFVDCNKDIREVFLGFVEVSSDTTGLGLSSIIKKTLEAWGLSLENCRGQTYDGAGGMAGAQSGCAARITADFPLAVYTHCYSHCLNLILNDCAKSTLVRNMVDCAEKVYKFFDNSPKRTDYLENVIKEVCPSTKQRLKQMCRTRFVERHDAFEVFVELYPAIERCFSDMSTSQNFNRETTSDATTLLAAITQFQFIVTLITVKNCMGYTKGLSKKLRGRSEDILSAYNSIEIVKATIKSVRSDINAVFSSWFEEITNLAAQNGIAPSKPRTCNRQTQRGNYPADTPEEYYRRSLVIPYIDGLISGLETRFSTLSVIASEPLKLIPTNVQNTTLNDLKSFINQYKQDLPSPCGISSELLLWKTHCSQVIANLGKDDKKPNTAAQALKLCNEDDFPNIFMMLKLVCTLGVTSCECERANSELGLLKTYLRSTMTQSRMNGLALMHVHYGLTSKEGFIDWGFTFTSLTSRQGDRVIKWTKNHMTRPHRQSMELGPPSCHSQA
ncbi:52 kDa repressor of the inhibitor of the protein kinase-like [Tubulanus polymorphus]|uniref:52 kDa repressor of the inhibitor of the protein kinase-like n=1 Tax=Tubulanus polymorphus TaxID=672921 RepID=UPI003DA34CA3